MKKILLFIFVVVAGTANAQQSYYSDVDITLTGQALYNELQQKINISNNTFNYGDVRDTMKITDKDPANSNNVLLIYGHNDANCTTQRSRDKDDFGGVSCEYNREHTFARSNSNPSMGSVNNSTTGIGADPHNLRPSDQQMNNNKGSKKFAAGSGNAGNVGSGNWYPGDEWKGDVARMMMYMYTRYGNRCLPSLNAEGTPQSGNDMLQIYLQWNVEDPVDTDFEDQRNNYLESTYGNRNPFIDNPYLATIIWGGEPAEDRWNVFSVTENNNVSFTFFPNPANQKITINTSQTTVGTRIVIYDLQGRKIAKVKNVNNNSTIDVSSWSTGIYLIKMNNNGTSLTQKLVVE